ncbi:MAG: hypothetical protein U0414_12530 [Polyangiaceae bacterium]
MKPKGPRRCKCGHERTHPMVSASGEYTFLGWCAILFGISAKPRAIRFQCRVCDQLIHRATDEQTIAETRLWG